MTLLVFGSTGQLAAALRSSAPDALFLNREAADLTKPDTCAAAIHAAQPSAVINAAAYTAVDRAEEEEALATTINATAPGAMARACADASIPFLHVSTDYVFEGSDQLNVVDDQIGGPSPACAIAQALLKMAEAMIAGQGGGTYHFAGAPFVSWAGFAREIFACSGQNVAVSGIPASAYPTTAQRPLNSRLDCTSLEADFGIQPPDWRAKLAEVVEELV